MAEQEHLDPALAQRVGEGVVLLAGPADPQHVVEEQRVLVGRRQALQLEIGTVQDDAPQRADLRAHVEAAGGGRRGGGAHAITRSRAWAASTAALTCTSCAV